MDIMDIMDILDIINIMYIMGIMDIMDIMDVREIIDIMNIMNITAWMAMAGAVSALVTYQTCLKSSKHLTCKKVLQKFHKSGGGGSDLFWKTRIKLHF